jgi:tetratricopeptide (TPR) repeat protein
MGRGDLLNPFPDRPGADLVSGVVLALWLASLVAEPILRAQGRARLGHGVAQSADLLLYLQVLANTGTRGGFLGLIAGLSVLVLGWLALRQVGRMPLKRLLGQAAAGLGLLALLLALVIAALGPSFRARTLASLRDPGQALETSRLQIWGPALKIWKDYPLTGSGVDTFKTVFPAYAKSAFNRYDGENVASRMAHCEPLQVLATEGVAGLGLWLWVCAALALTAWKALRREADEAAQWMLLGLSALAAAYLAQNLVSFGVAAISQPFWMAAALLGLAAATAPPLPVTRRPWGLASALLAGGIVAAAGLWAVEQTRRADLDYAFATQAVSSLPLLEKDELDSCRNAAAWAVGQVDLAVLPPTLAEEAAMWRQALGTWEQQLNASPAAGPGLLPSYRRADGALLMILAAGRLEQGVSLCPGEVKYRLYLGLCYEELYRRTPPARQPLWFQAAEAAYLRASAMNPLNAYYHGNLGRLYSEACDTGDLAYLPRALDAYRQAIGRAPAARLFYENALLLEARYAELDQAQAFLDIVAAHDPGLAPGLHMAAASTFFQWRSSKSPAWTPAKQRAALDKAVAWSVKARQLEPANPDYAFSAAVFLLASGQRQAAQASVSEALRLRPAFPEAQAWVTAQRLKP